MDECGFQNGAFQGDTFQICIPAPPTPVVQEEPRRWPGPSTILYSEDRFIPRTRREEDEVIIL